DSAHRRRWERGTAEYLPDEGELGRRALDLLAAAGLVRDRGAAAGAGGGWALRAAAARFAPVANRAEGGDGSVPGGAHGGRGRPPTVPPGRPLASRPIPTGRPRPWDTPAEPEAVEDEQVTAPIPVVGGAQDAPGGADPAEQEAERDGEPAEEPAGGGAAPAAPAPAEAAGAEPAALRPEPGTGPAGAATGKDWALPSAPTGPQRPFAPRSAATGPQPGLGDLLGASGAGRGPEGGRPAPPGERGAGPLQA